MVLHNVSQHFLKIRSTACSTFRLLHGGAEKDRQVQKEKSCF